MIAIGAAMIPKSYLPDHFMGKVDCSSINVGMTRNRVKEILGPPNATGWDGRLFFYGVRSKVTSEDSIGTHWFLQASCVLDFPIGASLTTITHEYSGMVFRASAGDSCRDLCPESGQ